MFEAGTNIDVAKLGGIITIFTIVFVMRTETAFGFLGNQKPNGGWASDISYSYLGLWIRHVFGFKESV